jgi:hypothetical protein
MCANLSKRSNINTLHTWMTCTVFRGSYWELPLKPVGSVISLTDESEVISYTEENNGLITIHYESVLFYASCKSKCMLRKASAILLLCPEFIGTMIYDSTFLCRKQLTAFVWGTNSRKNHYGFPVIQKPGQLHISLMYLRLMLTCLCTWGSHIIFQISSVTLSVAMFKRAPFSQSWRILWLRWCRSPPYMNTTLKKGVATSRQRVVLRIARCKESSVLWNFTKGTELGHIVEEMT